MIIDRLPTLPSAPTTGDELPIERLMGAYKIDYNALASAIIAQTQRDIAIVVEGNKTTHTGGAAVGAYVIVHNSTISGITDGLYEATQAIPANTAITSAYLRNSNTINGGLNVLNNAIQPLVTNKSINGYIVPELYNGHHYLTGVKYIKVGCFVYVAISAVFDAPPSGVMLFVLPNGYRPATYVEISVSGSETYNAKAQCAISTSGGVTVSSVDKYAVGGGIFIAS